MAIASLWILEGRESEQSCCVWGVKATEWNENVGDPAVADTP
jgi:hypothetical protein